MIIKNDKREIMTLMPDQKSFQMTDSVLVRNKGRGPKWIDGTVKKQTGPILFLIILKDA